MLQNEDSMKEICELVNEYYYLFFEDKGVLKSIIAFTAVDLDGDGIPEVILSFGTPVGYLTLRYYDNRIYGYRDLPKTKFKKDGTIHWSAGTGIGGYVKCKFDNGISDSIIMGTYNIQYNSEMDSYSDSYYYINKEEVSEEKWNIFYEEQEQKEDADWYEFDDENIINLLKTIPVSPQTGDNFAIFTFAVFAMIGIIGGNFTWIKKKNMKKVCRKLQKMKNF